MKLFSILTLALLLSLLSACDSSSDNDQSANTRARFVNLVTDSENISFEVDEKVTARNIGFRRASVFSNLSGEVDIDVELIDGDNTAATLINDQKVTFDGEADFVLFATGTSAKANLIVTQDSKEAPETDFTRVQFVNATEKNLKVTMASALNASQAVHTASLSPYGSNAADNYATQSVVFRVHDGASALLLETSAFSLKSKDRIAIVVTDYIGPLNAEASVDLLILESGAETKELVGETVNASLRFVHAITNLPSAVIKYTDADNASSASTVAYSVASGRSNIKAGVYDVGVASSANPMSSLFNTAVSLLGGFDFTYLLTGDIGSPEGILVIDELREIATRVQLKLVHVSQSLGNVDIYVSSNVRDPLSGTNVSDLPYRSQRSIVLDEGTYSVTATTKGSKAIVAGPFLLLANDGDIVDLMLREDETSGAPFTFSQF